MSRYRLKVRAGMVEGAVCMAVTCLRRGDHPAYVRESALRYSLPSLCGPSRLNGSERSIVDRLLRVGLDLYPTEQDVARRAAAKARGRAAVARIRFVNDPEGDS